MTDAERPPARTYDRTCAYCGDPFTTTVARQRFCKPAHRAASHRVTGAADDVSVRTRTAVAALRALAEAAVDEGPQVWFDVWGEVQDEMEHIVRTYTDARPHGSDREEGARG